MSRSRRSPALLAAEQGVHDLFPPLRYGQVLLREKMPRRFYCRARWHESALDSETQVFDLDFVGRDGQFLGGIREFTVKRAPREALLRGLGGDASRLLYTLGWHEVPGDRRPRRCARAAQRHLADRRVRRTGRAGARVHPAGPQHRSRTPGPGADGRSSAAWASPGLWRGRRASPGESTTAAAARLEAEVANLLSAVHTVQGGQVNCPAACGS